MWVERCIYTDLVLQRIHRHELFTPPSIGAAIEEGQNKFQVKDEKKKNGNSTFNKFTF